MSYGSKKWQDWVLDEDEALPLIEHAYKRGINTWDTVSGRSWAQITRAQPDPLTTGNCIEGRHILPWPLGRDPRQGSEKVLHPPTQSRHPNQMLLWRHRRTQRWQTASYLGLRPKRRRLGEPRGTLPQAHLRCGRCLRQAAGHVHRCAADPPSGSGDPPRGNHEGSQRCG